MGVMSLKANLRNIVVNNQNYVYWFFGGSKFILNISPKNNKNNKIEIIFKASPPNNERGYFWAFYKISSLKDNAEIVIELAQPKFVAEVIMYLTTRKDDVFAKKNLSKVSDGMALLRDMRYTNFNPIWIDEE